MKKELIDGVIDAVIKFIGACSNDVCDCNEEVEYVVFDGSVKTDSKGNIKTYSKSGDLVAQIPLRPILTNLKDLGHSVIDLLEADDQERQSKREVEAKAEAEAAERENNDIDSKIGDLQSEIDSLKLRKRSVRRFVK